MTERETAIDVCEGAIRNHARISGIVATDDAGSERSVHFKFSDVESQNIFAAVLAALKKSRS